LLGSFFRASDSKEHLGFGRLKIFCADVLAKAAPNAGFSFDGKIGGLIAFLAFHETYHVGQLSYLRKWLGYGQLVG
jgi:hypothetical protein